MTGMEETKSKLIKKFYRSLYRIRRVEEEIARIYPTDKIKSPVHLSIGQEAISVGVCEALRHDDVVFGTYRGHAMYLAKGGDLKRMIAELYGKKTGCAKGKGGSMHLIDEGAFHESMNFAALKKIPVLFVCENNFYAIHSHHLNRHHSDNICERAKSYGMPAEKIMDSDIFKIYELTSKYTEKMRKGKLGPVFLECITCRWKEHVGPNDDFALGYRNENEICEWMEKDPLKKLREFLEPNYRNAIETEVEGEIREAFQFAEESPFPGIEELCEGLFKE